MFAIQVYIQRCMDRFRAGRVADSVADADTALRLNADLAPYLWQRGISLYYVDRYMLVMFAHALHDTILFLLADDVMLRPQ
jgi:hypothetical protein